MPAAPPDSEATPPRGQEPLYGPVEVGARLGVKPQVVINWIREGRAIPHGVDAVGRNRFTETDLAALRAGLGTRRAARPRPGVPPAGGPGESAGPGPAAGAGPTATMGGAEE